MDNAVAPIAPQTLVPLHSAGGFIARVGALPAKTLLGLGIGVALLLAIAVALTLRQAEGEYRVLFAGLSDKDGGAVLAQLSQMNVPYKHAGAAVLRAVVGERAGGWRSTGPLARTAPAATASAVARSAASS